MKVGASDAMPLDSKMSYYFKTSELQKKLQMVNRFALLVSYPCTRIVAAGRLDETAT
jgi:hypothetical protein